ncbi:hypothetical protein PINS_up005448 [Pythium insidiosum]|nr:hypothetical protein PINS_up005448 [Pythium insidiosum]
MATGESEVLRACPRPPSGVPDKPLDSAPDASGCRAPSTSTTRPLWTRVAAGGGPSPRSGHAITLLPPTSSVLLFGGSDGNEFFADVYVLEPTQYAAVDGGGTAVDADAAPPSVALSAAMTSGDPFSTEEQEQEQEQAQQQQSEPEPEPLALSLVWKRLVVTQAPSTTPLARRFSRPSSGSSTSSSMSSSLASQPQDPMPHPGGGRDHHTMHYVPSPPEDERARGFRVIVLGNLLVMDGSLESDRQQSFETHEMRVEELRVRQPILDAQWSTKPIKSMWKPRARNSHCSAVRDVPLSRGTLHTNLESL